MVISLLGICDGLENTSMVIQVTCCFTCPNSLSISSLVYICKKERNTKSLDRTKMKENLFGKTTGHVTTIFDLHVTRLSHLSSL